MADEEEKRNKRSIFWFLIILVIVHLLDLWFRMYGNLPLLLPALILYTALIFAGYFLLLTKKERTDNGKRYFFSFLIVTALSIVLPMINLVFDYAPISPVILAFVWTIILFSPVWIFYLIFVFDGKKREYLQKVLFIYALLWIGFSIAWFWPDIQMISLYNVAFPGVHPPIAMDYIKDRIVDGLVNIVTDFFAFAKSQAVLWYGIITGKIEYAIDPYQSKTDEMNKQKVGFFFESLKPIPTSTFLEGNEVSVQGRVKAQVIENEININIDCRTGDLDGEIYPRKEWRVLNYFDERIDCSFPSLAPGRIHDIEMTVGAENFKTLSYLRAFFINEETLFELRKQNKDPSKIYDIKSGDFIAIYTPGPLKVSLDAGNPPIGVNTDEEKFRLSLGIGLTNNWLGELKKIKNVYLIIPESFDVVGVSGLPGKNIVQKINCDYLSDEDRNICDDKLENIYSISTDALSSIREEFEGVPIVLNVKLEGDPDKILQKQPFTVKYFKTTVVYDYLLSKKTSVLVKELK